MVQRETSKALFYSALSILISLALFSAGAFAEYKNAWPSRGFETVFSTLSNAGVDPRHNHLQPTRHQGQGVTINKHPDDGALILLNGFFEDESQVRLIRRDGSLFRKWSLSYLDFFPIVDDEVCSIRNNLDVDVHGVHLNPAGELVLNFEYCGLVKLDACGDPLWTLNEKTHHAVTPAESGGYWLLSLEVWRAGDTPDRFPPFSTPGTQQHIHEDYVTLVSASGEIIDRFSIPQLMKDSGLEALLTANNRRFRRTSVVRRELVHTNQVVELWSKDAAHFPMFAAGDLAISLRGLNLVIVLDPKTRRVKWHQTGPWLRQHDVEFRTDGRLSVFNNNTYLTSYLDFRHIDLDMPKTSNIMAIDPLTRETEILYGEREGEEFLSVIRGQHTLLEQDGILITEFDAGRVFEIDASGEIVWEFVNAYDDEWVGEILNAFVFEEDYFEIEWPTCS